jgi:heme exporter protein CcmD
MTLPDFGEHTPYVWAAFALSFLVILVLFVVSLIRARAAKSRLEEVRAALDDVRAQRKETA